jgi:hypothetical protein
LSNHVYARLCDRSNFGLINQPAVRPRICLDC